jgi:solute carrier organic anion transporter family, member 4A
MSYKRILDCRNSHLFLVIWLSLAAFLHNILMNGANNVVISSLQKEFYLTSRDTGIYVSVYDIGSLISSAIVPFLAARGSRPRWISFGMIMLFIGCTVNVVPHFLRRVDMLAASSSSRRMLTHDDANTIELCNRSITLSGNQRLIYDRTLASLADGNRSSKLGSNEDLNANRGGIASKFSLKYLLYTANIINGLSSASMTTLAFSYIEDISPPHLSSIYESVYYATGAFGVGIGFMATSQFLKMYTDFDQQKPLPIWLKPSHPNWIGAW